MAFGCVRVRVAIASGLAALLASALSGTEADARRGRYGRGYAPQARAASVYAPPFAAMVVDARTGKVMHAVAADELRHPASITKVMTLYLLFEQIERGALKLDSELAVSRRSATMPPSKLGVAPGESITVEEAIKAIVTRSANDIASAIAENLAGSEEEFAARMTRKARALGMSRTVYRNASGLPDREQVTTARDLTILARAIQERFPRLYAFFQTRSFVFEGQTIGNHNRLLGRVEGVDGIKTGFTTASGFNLMTSARSAGRHVVGVVLGGRSGASRDATMADLIRTYLPRASTSGQASVLAEAGEAAAAVEPPPSRNRLASVPDVETTASTNETPRRAAEAPVRAAAPPAARTAPLARVMPDERTGVPPERSASAAPSPGGKIDNRLPFTPAVPLPPEPGARSVETTGAIRTSPAAAPAPVARPAVLAAATAAPPAAPARAAAPEPRAAAGKAPAVTPWVIQLAAEENEEKAMQLLEQAKSSSGRALSRAAPFTEKVTRGRSSLYPALFPGFAEADAAQDACRALKSRGFACFATRS